MITKYDEEENGMVR